MSQELESTPTNTTEMLKGMAEGLGFMETELMIKLRSGLEFYLSEDEFRKGLTDYQDLADQQIQNAQDQAKAEIGFGISKAAIYLKVGRIEEMKAELEMAKEYAFNMYFDDVIKEIDSFLEKCSTEQEIRAEIRETLNRAEALLRGEYIDLSEAEELGQIFEGPIFDLNDDSLSLKEIEFVTAWMEKQFGFQIDKAGVKSRYESPDGETRVEIFEMPLGQEDDRWFLSKWQNKGEKPSYILWPQAQYEEQLELGYSEIEE